MVSALTIVVEENAGSTVCRPCNDNGWTCRANPYSVPLAYCVKVRDVAPRSMLGAFIRRQRESLRVQCPDVEDRGHFQSLSVPDRAWFACAIGARHRRIAASLGITVDELYDAPASTPPRTSGPSELARAIERAPPNERSAGQSLPEGLWLLRRRHRALRIDQSNAPSA